MTDAMGARNAVSGFPSFGWGQTAAAAPLPSPAFGILSRKGRGKKQAAAPPPAPAFGNYLQRRGNSEVEAPPLLAPSPLAGEGWGERRVCSRLCLGVKAAAAPLPSPAFGILSRKGRGKRTRLRRSRRLPLAIICGRRGNPEVEAPPLLAPSPLAGEGWGEGRVCSRLCLGVKAAAAPLPSPAFGILSRKGRGKRTRLRRSQLLPLAIICRGKGTLQLKHNRFWPPLPLRERVGERGRVCSRLCLGVKAAAAPLPSPAFGILSRKGRRKRTRLCRSRLLPYAPLSPQGKEETASDFTAPSTT